MHLSPKVLGKHFGNLTKVYGEYRFHISPNEQKAWKGFTNDAFVKVFKEYVWHSWHFYTPSVIAAYLVYDWAKKENYRVNRKDPKEFENDE